MLGVTVASQTPAIEHWVNFFKRNDADDVGDDDGVDDGGDNDSDGGNDGDGDETCWSIVLVIHKHSPLDLHQASDQLLRVLWLQW